MENVQALERAFFLLEVVADAPNKPHAISDLARRSRLTTSTVSRLVRTMARLGYLESAGRKSGYVLGRKSAELGRRYSDRVFLRRAGEPLLRRYNQETGEYVSISRMQGFARHTVYHLPPLNPGGAIATRLWPDIEIPYRSLSGRLLLAGLTRERQLRCYEKHGPPGPLWPEIDGPERLLAELEKIRAAGTLVAREGDMAFVACPVHKRGRIVAAAASYLPKARFIGAHRGLILKRLAEMAAELETL